MGSQSADNRAGFPIQYFEVARRAFVTATRQRELLPHHQSPLVAQLEKGILRHRRATPATQQVEMRIPGKVQETRQGPGRSNSIRVAPAESGESPIERFGYRCGCPCDPAILSWTDRAMQSPARSATRVAVGQWQP